MRLQLTIGTTILRAPRFAKTFLATSLQVISIGLSTGFLPEVAEAARVTQVKGSNLLLELESADEVSVGQRYLIMVGEKRRAIVEVTKIGGKKAVAKTLRGKPEVDGVTAPIPEKNAQAAASDSSSRKRSHRSKGMFSEMTIGLLGGYSMTTQEVKATVANTTTTENISMSGNGFSLKGFGDLPFAGQLGLIGRFGLEQFNVKGNAASRGAVKTEILYFSADLLFRYHFATEGYIPYVMGGLGIHFPASKSSDVLDVNRISSTTIFFFGGGVNIPMGDESFVTVSAEYGLFPPSNDVKTSMISARGGYGWVF